MSRWCASFFSRASTPTLYQSSMYAPIIHRSTARTLTAPVIPHELLIVVTLEPQSKLKSLDVCAETLDVGLDR